ncbi:hypothetical protein DFH08DRAFT_966353 [Mycena albidolilacea]|uniref:Uncharacterized protein n=1 Tax=Mycena albidolilacea TaxID=1033008 RepID=A0AAD6ZNJ7_9AGAR|nr:hypothetical protein DFH08DRAFT_966353 [Mycena albidolilacea]
MPPLASCAATVRTQDGTQERARCPMHHPHYAERHLVVANLLTTQHSISAHAGNSQWTTDVSAGVHRADPTRAPISHATHPVQRSSSTDPASLHAHYRPMAFPATSTILRCCSPQTIPSSTRGVDIQPHTRSFHPSPRRIARTDLGTRQYAPPLEHTSSSLYRGPDLTTFLRHTRSICLRGPPPLRTTTFRLACNAPHLRLAKRYETIRANL